MQSLDLVLPTEACGLHEIDKMIEFIQFCVYTLVIQIADIKTIHIHTHTTSHHQKFGTAPRSKGAAG